MNKKVFFRAILDGVFQSLILTCLVMFTISEYTSILSLEQILLIAASCAVLSSVHYTILALKESTKKKLVYFSLTSFLGFFLSMVITVIFRISVRLNVWPLREVNNADGILILFAIGCYILTSIILYC